MLTTDNLQNLWAAWAALDDAAGDAIQQQIYEIFTQLKQAAVSVLQQEAARLSRLGAGDEAVYDSLAKLMDAYRAVIDMGGVPGEADPAVHTLVAGICEVLGWRLKEFDDATACAAGQNPIAMEKADIINRAKLGLFMQVYHMYQDFVQGLPQEHPGLWQAKFDGLPAGFSHVIAAQYLPPIYDCFLTALDAGLAELDDLHSRQATAFFTEFMTREWETLGNIITVQAAALEAATADPWVQDILNALREAYQQLGPALDGLQRALHSLPPGQRPMAFDAFAAAVGEVEDVPPAALDSDFFTLLNDAVALLLAQTQTTALGSAETALREMIIHDTVLAAEIMHVFGNVKKALPTLAIEDMPEGVIPAKDALQEVSILQGIAETIDIKIDSLNDSLQTFDEDGQALLTSLAEETLADADTQKAQKAARAAWLASPPGFSAMEEFLFAAADSGKKRAAFYMEKGEKLSFRFKKEVLLYEVCTYEEILTHSALRLKASPWPAMAVAATDLAAAYDRLQTILGISHIMAICPAPHELFNAFEHEVLLAEKQEGFATGTIIKVLNTGYKQGNKVILRANVIAAR